MTKVELVAKVQNATGFTMKDSACYVDSVLDIMKEALEKGETIKVCGFGNFEIRAKSVRRGRNPHTGDDLMISARKVLVFRPSIKLKQALNR